MRTLTVVAIAAGIIALFVWLGVAVDRADKREQAAIRATCASYLHDSRTRSDSLNSRIACDQLWAAKKTKDAADAAAAMSAAAVGAAAAASANTGGPADENPLRS